MNVLLRKGIRIFNHHLHLETAGVIGPEAIWVLQYGSHLHAHTRLLGLIQEVIREYGHDRHLVS
jgi:hypothetical protein